MTNASVMTFNILSILPILVLSGFGMIVLVTDLVSSRKLGRYPDFGFILNILSI